MEEDGKLYRTEADGFVWGIDETSVKIWKQQGGNRTVAQLKAEREQEIKRPSLYFGEATNMQHLHF